jgi:Rrf2 family protein
MSTRFTVALHILTLLASSPGRPLTSDYIAGSVNTNPVVVRRLMAFLRKAGFVSSRPGNQGGWELAADPEKLTLAKVRHAINEGSPFSMHAQQPNPLCPVGRNIQAALGQVYRHAEQAMEDDLAQTTVASLLLSVRKQDRG